MDKKLLNKNNNEKDDNNSNNSLNILEKDDNNNNNSLNKLKKDDNDNDNEINNNLNILEEVDYNDAICIVLYTVLQKNFDKYSMNNYNTLILNLEHIENYLCKLENEKFIRKLQKKTLRVLNSSYIFDINKFNVIWNNTLINKEKCKNEIRLELIKYQNELRKENNIEILDI